MAEGQFASVEDIRREKLKLARSARKIAIANTFDAKLGKNFREYVLILLFFWNRRRSCGTGCFGTKWNFFSFRWRTLSSTPHRVVSSTSGCLAILIARMFGIPLETILHITFHLYGSSWSRTNFEGIHHSQIWDFSYNASPTANAAVLSAFGNLTIQGKKIALLGNMNELGKQSFTNMFVLRNCRTKCR